MYLKYLCRLGRSPEREKTVVRACCEVPASCSSPVHGCDPVWRRWVARPCRRFRQSCHHDPYGLRRSHISTTGAEWFSGGGGAVLSARGGVRYHRASRGCDSAGGPSRSSSGRAGAPRTGVGPTLRVVLWRTSARPGLATFSAFSLPLLPATAEACGGGAGAVLWARLWWKPILQEGPRLTESH